MSNSYVSAGEVAATNNSDDVVKTLALGSSVAVIFLDKVQNLAGLLHATLPDSNINLRQEIDRPGTFVDTGIPKLIELMKAKGYKENGNLTIKLVGGASILHPQNMFNIGKRNILAIKNILHTYNLEVKAEDTGGSISRSVSVECGSGRVSITSSGRGIWEI